MSIEGDRGAEQGAAPSQAGDLEDVAGSVPTEALWHEVLERLRTVQDNQAKLAGAVESLGSVVRDVLGPDSVPPEVAEFVRPPAPPPPSGQAAPAAPTPAPPGPASPAGGPPATKRRVPPSSPSRTTGTPGPSGADVRRITGRRLAAGTEPIMDALLGFKTPDAPATAPSQGTAPESGPVAPPAAPPP
ncbi:MAG TPA: hypothetical protein VMB82_04320, partial [Acidimicrobiales bacterium]|nr:hypothetical protein [Acidimicrobiales bacterium]